MENPTYTVTVTVDKAGLRLDQLLASTVPELSRMRLKLLIEGGHVDLVGGGIALAPARRVSLGEVFAVMVPPVAPFVVPDSTPEPMPLVVVHEDDDVIVIDKPPGLVVHPGAGNPTGTVVNGLLAHCQGRLSSIGGPLRPGIVHRLDKDTSGLMVAAKTDAAHLHLATQFARHWVERVYYALVWGVPRAAEGVIEHSIGRSPINPTRMAVVPKGGKRARTAYRTLQRFGDRASLIECRPTTGRTHQIRVHMAAIGHPLMGDGAYGDAARRNGEASDAVRSAVAKLGRQALHAYVIGFEHPSQHTQFCFEVPMANDISQLITCLEQF
jgi:23S rRNA pseudouridine1911/1915/1917 synthase